MSKGEFIPSQWTKPVDLGGGFSMSLPVMLQVANSPRDGFMTQIEFVYSPIGPLVNGVAVTRMSNERGFISNQPVTGEMLREVTVAELCKEHLPSVITRFSGPVIPTKEELKELVEAGPKNGLTLALIQQLYFYAELTGQRPAKFVQDTLNLTPATTGRWIRRSKEKLLWDSLKKERDSGND